MARKKIQRLTPEQEAKFPAYVAEWKAYGLSTEPADRPRAEAAIRWMYAQAGLAEPKIIWTQSPLGNAVVAHLLKNRDSVKASVRASVWDSVRASVEASVRASVRNSVWNSVRDSVRNSVRASVWASVGDSVWDSVRASVEASVRASVRNSVWNSVRDSVRNSVRASVWDSVGNSVRASVLASVEASVWASVRASVIGSVGASGMDSVRDSVLASVEASARASVRNSVWNSVRDSVRASVWDSVGNSVRASVRDSVRASVWDSVRASVMGSVGDSVLASVYGQHDASWLAFYRFFSAECGLGTETAALHGLWELCQSAGWAMPFDGCCLIAERHDVCRLDDNGRIHAEDGPAIHYPDGFAIYAWHGTRIPAEWIEDRTSLTAKIALTWNNIEQRRAACEILGWKTILAELSANTIDRDEDPEIGELVEVDIPDIGRERFLRVMCGTKREFALPVPPTMKTALEANAWTYAIDANEFIKPEIRT